jgi:hypothetical protein
VIADAMLLDFGAGPAYPTSGLPWKVNGAAGPTQRSSGTAGVSSSNSTDHASPHGAAPMFSAVRV